MLTPWNRMIRIFYEGEGAGGGGGDTPPAAAPTGETPPPAKETWKEGIPEHVQEWDEFKNSDNQEGFWAQIENMRGHLGNSIRIPGPDAGEGDWAAFNEKLVARVPTLMPKPDLTDENTMNTFYDSLGRPEEADKYEVPEIKVPKGIEVNMNMAEGFKAIAHEAGLNQTQFNKIVQKFADMNISMAQTVAGNIEQELSGLKEDWGLAFDTNVKGITGLLEKTNAPEPLVKAIKEMKVDRKTMEWLYGIAKSYGPEAANLANDQNQRGENILTPAEAVLQINEIMNNKTHPYWQADHPNHQNALREMLKLQKMANPSASTNINDLRGAAPQDMPGAAG